MHNMVYLLGRLTSNIEIEEKDDKRIASVKLAVPRNFKNENGEYDTDFIECLLYTGIAENTVKYCKNGDLVGIKGRLQNEENTIKVIAEKVSFLQSKSKESED